MFNNKFFNQKIAFYFKNILLSLTVLYLCLYMTKSMNENIFLLNNNNFFFNSISNIYMLLIFFFNNFFIEFFFLFLIFWIIIFKTRLFFIKKNYFLINYFIKEEIYYTKQSYIILFFSIFIYFYAQCNSVFLNDFFFYNYSIKIIKMLIIFFFFFIFEMYLNFLKKANTIFIRYSFIFILLLSFLVVSSILFLMVIDFLVLFIILIILNISVYSLLNFDNAFISNTQEATIKYFLLSTIATLFFLGGISLNLLFLKTTNFILTHLILIHNVNTLFFDISTLINNFYFLYETNKQTNMLDINVIFLYDTIKNFWKISIQFIFMFLFIGFSFKLAIFPLQSWSVDIYSSINYKIITIYILIFKILFFLKFIQIYFFIFLKEGFFQNFILISAIFSIFIGSFMALYEDKIKKIIAYSSIANFGYILTGLVHQKENTSFYKSFSWEILESLQYSIFYLLIYLISNLILLYILDNASNKNKILYLHQLKNISKIFSFILCITIFSMSSIPPLAGFFSKYLILQKFWKNGFYFLTFFILICSLFNTYYYLKIIKTIFFEKTSILLEKEVKNFITPYISINKFSFFNNLFLNFCIYILTLSLIIFNIFYTEILIICFKIIVNYIYLFI